MSQGRGNDRNGRFARVVSASALSVQSDERLVERASLGIVGRAVAQPVRAGKLDPAAAIPDEAQQALETGRTGAGARIRAAHMVDHHGQAD